MSEEENKDILIKRLKEENDSLKKEINYAYKIIDNSISKEKLKEIKMECSFRKSELFGKKLTDWRDESDLKKAVYGEMIIQDLLENNKVEKMWKNK